MYSRDQSDFAKHIGSRHIPNIYTFKKMKKLNKMTNAYNIRAVKLDEKLKTNNKYIFFLLKHYQNSDYIQI